MAPAIHSSLTHFNLEANPRGAHRRGPQLPDEPGRSHAYRPAEMFSASRTHLALDEHRAPQFLEGPEEYARALCGQTIKVLLPLAFNAEDPDACPSCTAKIQEYEERERLIEQERSSSPGPE